MNLESTTLTQRVVLLGVLGLADRGETPAFSHEIRAACEESIDDLAGGVVGQLSEGDVMRALNELEAAGLVSQEDVDHTSPVGKGRPAYAPAVDAASVFESLADDDRIGPLVAAVRGD